MDLKTINNPGVEWESHKINISGLCPRTGNPQPGSYIVISYTPTSKILEYYSLTGYVKSFTGSREVRDLERLVKVIADDCAGLLETPVTVLGEFVLDIGQTVTIRASANGKAGY